MFNLKDWFSTKNTLVGRIACLRFKNIELEYQLSRKSLAFDKAIEDNALQHSFLTAQIEQLKAQLAEAKPSFTLPNNVKLVAEYNRDYSWESIDIVAHAPNGRFQMVCCADFEHDAEYNEPRGLRIFSFNGRDEEYCHEVLDFDFSYLLGKNDLDPETEQDYIDQVIQDQADRASKEVV